MKKAAESPAKAVRAPAIAAALEPSSAKPDDPLFVTALARGLEVLRCCARSDSEPTVSEIAKRIGLPQATVWRLSHTLIELEYLERTEQDRLRPGLRVLDLGYSALQRSPLADLAKARMETLAHRYKGAVSLGVPDGLEILYVRRVEGGATVFTGLRAGSRVSILTSAMGWGYIAGVSSSKRAQLLQTLKKRMPEEFSRLHGSLRETLAQFPVKGYMVTKGVLHPEINAIAVPIGASTTEPVACVSFGGPRTTFPMPVLEREIGPLLTDLASTLTKAATR